MVFSGHRLIYCRATHNPNVTDVGKQQARNRLESMGEHPDKPAD